MAVENNKSFRMLVIDDDELIRDFVATSFEENGWVVDEAENGLQGIELVKTNPDRYNVVLLDNHMPGPKGLDVLPELIKYGDELAVLMMTGYAGVDSAVEAMHRGACDYLQKPLRKKVLEARVDMALKQRIIRKEHRQYVEDIEKKIKERSSELEEARKATILGLTKLAEYRDEDTGYHLERMSHYVFFLARSLRENGLYRQILTASYLDRLFESAPLHDIGKIGIADSILKKPGKLTAEEFCIMKTHSALGAKAIEDIQVNIKGQTFLSVGVELARSHHENYDGSGYPQGLEKENIPLCARILALADFYDALTCKRVYRPFAYPHEKVKEMIIGLRQTKFDPVVVDSFLENEKMFVALHKKYCDQGGR